MAPSLEPPDWIEPREYQQSAVRAWFDAGGRGILNMATGSGKTVTALLAAAELADRFDGRLALVVAAPYQHLVDQWSEDLREFGVDPVLAYRSRRRWQERLERELLEFNVDSRETLAVVTTHDTFASTAFRSSLSRLDRPDAMLVADEVHHLGAPHRRDRLPDAFGPQLGLSATPRRWHDDAGTEELFSYFGDGVVYEFGLEDAIDRGALCEYYYVPHTIELTDEEADEYRALSAKIARLAADADGELGDLDLRENDDLKHALFRRARIVGTAANKVPRLAELLRRRRSVEHTLVYCGDGSVEDEVSGETRRHVDATTATLRDELGLDVGRFTAEESQSRRRELLSAFEAGEIDCLTAIRCLDEGVDVPATRTAYVLASSTNPRQFVQRRGRILRPHEGKDRAVIHDFVVVPPHGRHPELLEADRFSVERSLVRRELRRVSTFAEAAINHPDADVDGVATSGGSLQALKRQYDLRQL